MPKDIAVIEDRIKKIQLILQLAADPAIAQWIRIEVVSPGGMDASTRKSSAQPQGLRSEILKHVPDASDVGNYRTAKQITSLMDEARVKFRSKDHAGTVRDFLRELEKEGLVERAGKTEEGASIWRKPS
jgi:hypothetical protein